MGQFLLGQLFAGGAALFVFKARLNFLSADNGLQFNEHKLHKELAAEKTKDAASFLSDSAALKQGGPPATVPGAMGGPALRRM